MQIKILKREVTVGIEHRVREYDEIMNFSELFQQSNQLCKFSPNGRHVCSCSQCRVVIRDVATLQIVAIFTCADPVQYIEWASDSVHVMCGMFKRGMVQVWWYIVTS